MKLFYNPGSSNSRRVEATVRHLDLTGVEMVLLDHFSGAHRTPEYGAINPNFQIPALQDGDFTLWESNAIMQYLAEGSSLYPDDPQVRADISRWQFWTSFNFGPTTAALIFERAFKSAMGFGAPDEALIEAESKKLETFSKVLDAHLEGRKYLVGDALTIADFAVCAEMSFNSYGQLDFSAYENMWRGPLASTRCRPGRRPSSSWDESQICAASGARWSRPTGPVSPPHTSVRSAGANAVALSATHPACGRRL